MRAVHVTHTRTVSPRGQCPCVRVCARAPPARTAYTVQRTHVGSKASKASGLSNDARSSSSTISDCDPMPAYVVPCAICMPPSHRNIVSAPHHGVSIPSWCQHPIICWGPHVSGLVRAWPAPAIANSFSFFFPQWRNVSLRRTELPLLTFSVPYDLCRFCRAQFSLAAQLYEAERWWGAMFRRV